LTAELERELLKQPGLKALIKEKIEYLEKMSGLNNQTQGLSLSSKVTPFKNRSWRTLGHLQTTRGK
jgi:hypothetical protein